MKHLFNQSNMSAAGKVVCLLPVIGAAVYAVALLIQTARDLGLPMGG